ncbi:hypothetical protein F441_11697 [Phytophthora nicotianae CJ01A1]|uniref:Uncharacterized protein n=1 Tax=Phytophthora nicotianae CJ01A1 TaxID=1317063 RepID=W2WRR7_PHYNI|nr:hypothetical protein F441_11697 [Phytophthora nicotianae CJ01A1]
MEFKTMFFRGIGDCAGANLDQCASRQWRLYKVSSNAARYSRARDQLCVDSRRAGPAGLAAAGNIAPHRTLFKA